MKKTRTDNTMINIDSKSSLAKLLATENITVQHNSVPTASFNLEDRVLTLPVFKNPKGYVYDMLIAHEVSHALNTPNKEWQEALKEKGLLEIKDYINVIEDVRIDKLIQKKYPGVVEDYINGFKILWNDDFFSCKNKNLDTDLMLIDKINLYFKSSKTLNINFSNEDKLFVNLVDSCKTFKDVIEAAKKLADWQNKQIDSLKKLPDFDSHPLTLSYGEKQEKEENEDDDGSSPSDKSDDEKSDLEKAIEESNAIKKEAEDKKESTAQTEDGESSNKEKSEDKKETKVKKDQTGNPDGAGGKDVSINMPLKSITQNANDEKIKQNYVDNKHRGFNYMQVPDSNLDQIIYPMKKWVSINAKHLTNYDKNSINENLQEFKQFKKDSARTISYLVKEFEMKKSADGYKRSTTDKTGIIDPLKLHKYKISEDIFKRLSIIPDAKNHGMILLLDWSGSMCNVIDKTVEQLLQLIWFVQRIGIPYKVYFFSDKVAMGDWNERRSYADKNRDKMWKFKSGDTQFDVFNLVEIANHTSKKSELEQSLFYLFAFGKYFGDNYGRRNWADKYIERIHPPSCFNLSSTPLNEAIATMYKIIPMFKQKYQVDKMSLITLTDGHSNSSNHSSFITNNQGELVTTDRHWGAMNILKLTKSKSIKSTGTTNILLEGLRRKYNVTNIGFFILKTRRSWEFENYALSNKQQNLSYELKHELLSKIKSEFSKNKCAAVQQEGYNEFYIINGKTMKVENSQLNDIKTDAKAGEIKRIFGKSMKQRTVSRVLLSKFIKQVA